jgi:hypothetical protein
MSGRFAPEDGQRPIKQNGGAMHDLGRMLLGIGLLIALIGAAILLASRIGLPMGRMPGDISYRRKNVSFYFPIGTSIPISIVLSLILYFFSRFRR